MRAILLLLCACTTTEWHGSGPFSASFTAPDGSLRAIPKETVYLEVAITSPERPISLCSQRSLSWEIALVPVVDEISVVVTDLDSALCGTGTAVVTRAHVETWTRLGSPASEAAGWTVAAGAVIVTSYVHHHSSDPPDPNGPPGTPIESIEGTVSFDLEHTSGAAAHLAGGTFVLDTTESEHDNFKFD
jgi:hypothetical protein